MTESENMRTILIINDNERFIEDMEGRLFFSEIEGAALECTEEIDNLQNVISYVEATEIVINKGSVKAASNVEIPIFVYARTEKENAINVPFPSYGLVKTAGDLIDALQKGQPKKEKRRLSPNTQTDKKEPAVKQKPQKKEHPVSYQNEDFEDFFEDDIEDSSFTFQNPRRKEFKKKEMSSFTTKESVPKVMDDYEEEFPEEESEYFEEDISEKPSSRRNSFEYEENSYTNPRKAVSRSYTPEYEEDDFEGTPKKHPVKNQEPRKQNIPKRPAKQDYSSDYSPKRNNYDVDSYETTTDKSPKYVEQDYPDEYDDYSSDYSPKRRNYDVNSYETTTEDDYPEERYPAKRRKKRSAETAKQRSKNYVNEQEKNRIIMDKRERSRKIHNEIEEDLGLRKKPAKTVAVYSAKGGVGKTTLACEIATCISRMRKGDGSFFDVCVVDYNIDFGDVLMTLGYDHSKMNLSHWADRVRSDLLAYDDKDDLTYTKNEIRSFLQKNEETGLYALIAPITNDDSMNIESDELHVMLRNLIDNGGFDYIICDTGNNTRDSTIIALDLSDIVLLVSAQSATTVNCNDSLLAALNSTGFDMSKFQLIINRVNKAKEVGLTTDDVWKNTINPKTGRPIPRLAIIKESNDVKYANNLSDPLSVRDSTHPFTVQIRKISAYITEQDYEIAEPEKKKLFSFFRKK